MTNFTATGDWTSQGSVNGLVNFTPVPASAGSTVTANISAGTLLVTLPVISGSYLVTFQGITANGQMGEISPFTFASPQSNISVNLLTIVSPTPLVAAVPGRSAPLPAPVNPVSQSPYVPWLSGVVGVLPATTAVPLTTQGGNTLDDGSGNVVFKGGTITTQSLTTNTSILYYGAKCDGQQRWDANILVGSLNQLSCTGFNFGSADVGKTIIVGGDFVIVSGFLPSPASYDSTINSSLYNVAPGSTTNAALVTTIASVSNGKAVLATPATNAMSNVYVAWGTDDGAAWTTALTNWVNNGGQLTMPSGISICGQSISLAPAAGATQFSLRGASMGTSQIISTAPGGFLTLNLTGELNNGQLADIDFADLNLVAALAGNTHALSVNMTSVAGTTDRYAVTINRVTCGSLDSVVGYWDKPIEVLGAFRPVLRDVVIFGLPNWQPDPGSGDFSDTSIMYLPTCGIRLDGSISIQLVNTDIRRCNRGIQMVATNSSPEFFLDSCVIESCKEGLYYSPSPTGQQARGLNFRACFWDNRDYNMLVVGKQHGNISHHESWFTPFGWAPSSTLATAVNTGTTPTTLTLASTAQFPLVGAVQIGSEWFIYNNLSSGMNGTTLNNVVRAQFGTVDPGSNYSIGATVTPAQMDILLVNNNDIHIDNNIFVGHSSNSRISVLLHSLNAQINISNNYYNTGGIGAAIGNDSTGTQWWSNQVPGGTTPIIGSAALVPLNVSGNAATATKFAAPVNINGVPFDGSGAITVADSTKEPLEAYSINTAAYTLTSTTSAQQLLNATANGAITLPVGQYFFECGFSLTGMSSTSGAFGFGFGGTATFAQNWVSLAAKGGGLVGATALISWSIISQSIVAANTNTQGAALIKGRINVTVAGTLIPQVSLTVAAAAIVGAGAYFRIQSVNSTAADVGAWS